MTQRGNRRMDTFFKEGDYGLYIELMSKWCGKWGVEIWAYCLMPNHVHLVAVPSDAQGLAKAIGEAHKRYTKRINQREGWRGYLWQGRFASYVMDEEYLAAATRYIEINPVRAGIVKKPWDYRWSSAAAHIKGESDGLVNARPLLDMFGDWRKFLGEGLDVPTQEKLRKHSSTGYPLGSEGFVARLEKKLKRKLIPQKVGRPLL